ncbi:hypothetical protein [Spirosoma fluviale]|uniref:Uncharacterized protein n=1 Tax=Spirosoma fluviale TaxID=1597977 RepID=A0A286GA37_9BACT|nr:hypothetical protein [Spirosoma fluviale]SOD92413.1 hypothetical protein SAMN06269250_3966 [Spirosoma fluviale]
MLLVSATAYAQKGISVQLTLINQRASATAGQDVGLLLDVKNQTNQDVALFTPLGDLMNYVKYYKLNRLTNQYTEILHPFYEEIKRENALKDSVFSASGVIIDFFGQEDYNSKSGIYRQFIRDDSLWYNHQYNTEQYAKRISETDVQHFRQVTGLNKETVLFTMVKAQEHYQDFYNASFLYAQPGDYKILLELSPLTLQGGSCLVGGFRVKESGTVSSNELHLHVP